MAKVVSVDLSALILKCDDESHHELWDHEYWILCPYRTGYVPTDGNVGPLSFGVMLHNAKISNGFVLAQEDLLNGNALASMKSGAALKAENLLEEIRQAKYPNLPSRLRCHYLNHDKATAEARAVDWNWHNRSLERCYIVRSGGTFHHADVALYEKLVTDPENAGLAEKYWQPFHPSTADEQSRLEVLANSCLFFPDWKKFPEIDITALALWNQYRGGNRADG
ncbi:DUF2441 domain-containing protein [Stutzerimonas nitrititolerans]|uniref:DUF2441 domain-containing protein n=1 Tax=Stutzerimonas nitrititolerans TaxID=2482751 RepID=UPI002899618D|nr:DUF2441 domain-containing protein [Stutzerimonas nitrititolerans]